MNEVNEKKRKIIEVGMKLFAKKGFYATSIQEIAEKSGVSKGGFYIYFKSKEDLILSIYQYYYDLTKSKMEEVEKRKDLGPKEKLAEQLFVYFEQFDKQKDFIVMQFRENFHVNKELDEIVLTMRAEFFKWYERRLYQIYGRNMIEYIAEGSVLLDGLLTSYIKVMLCDDVKLDFKKLSNFIVRRIDNLMAGLSINNEKPLITRDMLQTLFKKAEKKSDGDPIVKDVINEIEKTVVQLDLVESDKEDVLASLQVLKDELKKDEPQKVVIQGMLANMRHVKEIASLRETLADHLEVSLR